MQGLYKHNLPRDIKLFLAKPNRQIIAPLKFAYQRTITWNEDSPSELSFSLPYEINVNHKRKKYAPVTQLKEKFLIKAVTNDYEEWFIITNPTKAEDDTTSLSVNCLSAEQTLAKKKLIEFKRTSYNPLMILNDILPGTGYTVGYINPKLNLKYREFDISSTSKLDFIYTDMTDTYEALAVFDTVDKTVSLYEKNELSDYKGFIVNDRRYLMGIENDIDTTELVTRLHVTGSDGLGINSVNPTGQRYIDDFSYFLFPFEIDKEDNIVNSSYFMEDDLSFALLKYNEYVSGRKDEFKKYLDKKAEEQQELTKLQTDLFDSDTELKTVLDSIAWMKEEGLSTTDKQNERKKLNAKIKKLNSEIKNIEESIEKIDGDIKQLGEDLRYDNHLSSSQMEQLNYFIHEEEWTDDNKIDPSDLYESGIEELKERNSPPVNMSVTLANFLKDAKAVNDWKRLNLSDIVRIQKPKLDIDVKVRVSSISINFDDPSIELELSNYKELNSLENKLKSVFYRVNKVNTDFNKRKIDYDRVANNFNLRNDRIKEIPEEPTVGKNAIKHRKNNDGSVDITVKWTYPDYVKTDKKAHAIDGFMLYFHNDTEDEVYQFTSQMANEQITSVPYPTRTFVYPSVPADLFYTIGVRAYRRVDPDVNRDGILMSPIVRFNDGVGGFDEIESQSESFVAALANYTSPLNEENDDEDVSKPYRPEEEINISGRVNGTKQTTGEFPPPNPKIGDIWINTNDRTVNIWNGTSWAGNKLLEGLQVEFRDYVNQVAEEDHELKEKLDKAQKDLDEAMERVDSELERIENEVVPEIEQSVRDTFIPRQDYPPDPENLPPSGMWQDITQDPPRMMRWDPELGEWVVLAPNEEEIDEMIDKVVESAKQEYREYTDEEIQKERDRIMDELNEKSAILDKKVSELLDKAENMFDKVDEIDKELVEQKARVEKVVDDVADKADMGWVNEQLTSRSSGIIQSPDEPEEPEENQLWLDTAHSPNILKRWNGEQWIKASPTDAEDVGAYTFKEVDDALNSRVSVDEYTIDQDGIVERFETNETTISNVESQISFKADQTALDKVNNTIEDHSAQLNVQAELIESKVDALYVDGKIEGVEDSVANVREYASSIEQTAERVDTSLSSLQKSHNNLGEQVDKNSTDISIQAGLIEGKLDSITYSRDKEGILESIEQNKLDIQITAKGLESKAESTVVDKVEDTITGHTAELKALATGLSSKVDEIFVRGAIDEIEVGGRNLIINSNTFNFQTFEGSSLNKETNISVPEYNIDDAVRITTSRGTTNLKALVTYGRIGIEGEVYTASVYVKNNLSESRFIRFNGLNSDQGNWYEQIIGGNEAVRFVYSGIRNTNNFQFQVRTSDSSDDVDFTVWHDQLEKGNKASDYSLAPEDIISVQENHSTAIEQTSRDILLQAQSISRIDEDISSAESRIDVLANEINQRVEQTVFNNETGALRESISNVRQLATGIEQTVSDIQIGGTNLNRDSNNFSRDVLSFYDGSALSGYEENVSVEEWGATDATEIRASAGNSTSLLKVFKTITDTSNTVLGKTYTVSFYVKNLRDVAMSVNVNGILPRPTIDIKANEAKRIVVTGERGTNGLQLQFRSFGNGFYTHFVVWRAQVEEGNMVTPWSSALEDTDQRMSKAESSITQLSNQITTKVERDGVISSINQTSESVGINAALIDFSGVAKFEPFSKNYYQSKSIANGSGGRWYRIAKNTGSRAHAKIMLRDTTASQHGTAVFEAGVNYSNRPYINLTSYGRYSSASFSQARILTNTTYDEVYLEVYINDNARTQNLAYWITENVQDSGWEAVNWTNGSIPSGYRSFVREIDEENVTQGTVDKWKHGNTTLINGGEIYTNSITASQLNVNQIFGNSAVIAKIQSNSVLTANLSATRITTGTLNASNVSVVNLSASSLTSGILDANRVTVRNLTAESIVSQSIEARHIKSLNGLNVNNQFKVDNSGRVSIGNDRITIDYNGISITRPDGVVWMQDGVVRTSYMVGGFDPPYMDKYDTTVGESWPMFSDEGKWYWASADAMVGEGHYIDVRNAGLGYTVGFQRYEFSHDARYLVMGYRSGIDGRNPRHQTRIYDVSDNASITTPDRHPMLHQQWHSRGGSGVVNMTIDLGKPTYQKKAIELRIGINKADRNASTDRLLFRINRTYVTDYPQD